jgi:hypothetical protein
MINTTHLQDLIGAEVLDSSNEKVGKVGQVYLDANDSSPAWASVRTGLFGTSGPSSRSSRPTGMHRHCTFPSTRR